MQTFLPYADFARSAAVLDPPRLGKQRVETLQILRALTLSDYGWANHPAVTMWRGRTPALVRYGLECVTAWQALGHGDSTRSQIAEFAPEVPELSQRDLEAAGVLPSWVGDERVHASHRSALLRKDPAWYRPRLGTDVPEDLPYHWPDPDDVQPEEPTGDRAWVVRPDDDAALGRFLSDGVVGVGTEAGLSSDLTGADEAALRAMLRALDPPRRPGKKLRQLSAFLSDVTPGDRVAVPVEGETALLLGTVTGGYAFDPHVDPAHRRSVSWQVRAPRSRVRPRGALQDPRRFFRVHLLAG